MAQRPRFLALDWMMLALAVVSVALLVYEAWGNPTQEQARAIVQADLIIVGIFIVEFSFRWLRDSRPKTFALRNWYEVLGMIPVAHPALRAFRLLRVLRIVVIVSRFGGAADRAFGEEFTYRFVRRFKDIITEVIADTVTVRVLDMTLDVLQKGEYAANMAHHMEAHGDEMMEIIMEKVREDPKIGRIKRMPFFEDIVETSSRVTQRLVIELLRDPRMDQMLKDIIKQNTMQIREAVREKESLRRP